MNLRLAFVAALGVSGVVFACSGSSTGGTGAAAGDSQSFINEFCGLYAPCCGKVGKPTDGASCRALYGGLLGNQQYNSSKGNACLTELRAQSNAPDYCDNPTAQAPSCNGAFIEAGGGNKQPGEDCSKDGDCASSTEGSVNCASSYSGSAVTKSCQVEIVGKAGDTPCISTKDGNTTYGASSFSSGDAGPTRPAAKGYVCDVANRVYCSSKTKACAPINDVGGACDTSDRYSCVKTAFCDSSLKQCVARHAVGEDCSTFTSSCVDKANCDTTTKKCIAGLADGTVCKTSTQCASNQCVNGKCDKSSSGDFSTQLLCGGN